VREQIYQIKIIIIKKFKKEKKKKGLSSPKISPNTVDKDKLKIYKRECVNNIVLYFLKMTTD
jgi:hypothetical protein